MSTVTIGVSSRTEVKRRMAAAFKGKPQGSRISFASAALLLRVLTKHRLELLGAMCSAGPLSLREAARRVGRDVKRVHGDVHALLNAGVLRKTQDGQIEFPYDAVRVEFELKAA